MGGGEADGKLELALSFGGELGVPAAPRLGEDGEVEDAEEGGRVDRHYEGDCRDLYVSGVNLKILVIYSTNANP